MTAWHDEESERYERVYRDPLYKMGPSRLAQIERLLEPLPRGSLLDVGCGRGEAMAVARRLGYSPVSGTETAPSLVGGDVVLAYADALPCTADVVTCLDVLEHVPQEHVEESVRGLGAAAHSHLVLTISSLAQLLHCTVWPSDLWQIRLEVWLPGWSVICRRDEGNGGISTAWVCIRADKVR